MKSCGVLGAAAFYISLVRCCSDIVRIAHNTTLRDAHKMY